jgi:hypothetical protein
MAFGDIVGTAALYGSSGASGQVTLTTTASGIIVVAITHNKGSDNPIASITDGAGLTYNLIAHTFAGVGNFDLWYAVAASTVSSNIITVTPTASADYLTIHAFGVDITAPALDADASNPNSGTSGARTISTATADTVIVGAFRSSGTANPTAGAGFTRILGGTGGGFTLTQSAVFGSTQSGLSVNSGEANNGGVAVAFKAGAGAAGQPTTKRFGGVEFFAGRGPAQQGMRQW